MDNVLIAGTRIPVDPLFFLDTMRLRLKKHNKPTVYIRGSNTHCEALIKRLAQREGIPVNEFNLDFKDFTVERAAARDIQLCYVADYAYIWWDGFSKDIKALIDTCKKLGVKTKVYYLEVSDAQVQQQ